MKVLFTIILGIFFLTAAADKPSHLKIYTGKKAGVEIRYTSASIKNTAAVFTVTNAEGKIVSTQSSDLACGDNSICLCEALNLPEGTYTVQMKTKKKTMTSQFIIWK